MMFGKHFSVIVLCVLVSQPHISEATRPNVEMRILNTRPVVGEPLVVDFVVSNDTREEICTPPLESFEGALVEFVLYAYTGANFVGRSKSSSFCGKRLGVLKFDGHCTESLKPRQQLDGHGLAVLLMSEDKNIYGHLSSVPLAPETYTLRADVIWGDWRLTTDDIQIEIVAPISRDDVRASELVDPTFASFMSSYPTMGIGRNLIPTGSVKAILEQCPTSIHARLARPRLLVLQAHMLKLRYGVTEKERQADKRQMLDVVTRINQHLAANPDDPLALDLMAGKVHLLRRLEREDELRQAIDALIAKYPHSPRTRRAQDMWKQLHSNPTARE